MYYILGERLWNTGEPRERKDTVASNSYILALDGDVHFKPEAVLLLAQLMKKDPSVGAACGRIHPIGRGRPDRIGDIYPHTHIKLNPPKWRYSTNSNSYYFLERECDFYSRNQYKDLCIFFFESKLFHKV